MESIPKNLDNIKLKDIYDKLDDDAKQKILNVLNREKISNQETKQKSVREVKQVDKTTEKYKIALIFVNKILIGLGKNNIDDLTEFKDINRELIITPNITKIFTDFQPELFNYFDKVKCGWYKRNTTKNYILTFLRCMCDDLELNFEYKQKDITVYKDGKGYRITNYFYYIC